MRDCLESVRRQTVAAEHIVVDGQSTDGTVEILRSCSRPGLVVISEPDEGIYDAMRKGIARATGDVVGTLNADDFYAGPEVLRKVAAVFEDAAVDSCYGDLLYVKGALPERSLQADAAVLLTQHSSEELERRSPTRHGSTDVPHAGSETGAPVRFMVPMRGNEAVEAAQEPEQPLTPSLSPRRGEGDTTSGEGDCCSACGVDRDSTISGLLSLQQQNGEFCLPGERVVRHWKAGSMNCRSFYWGWMPPHPTFFVRRSVYERLGMFRLDLGTAADYEMMLRLLVKHRITTSYIPEVLVKMRAGGVSNTSLTNRLRANRHDRRAWVVNDLRPYPWTLWLKPLRKVVQWL